MPRITAAEFEKTLKKGLPPKDRLPVYFLYGMAAARVQSAAEAVKDAILPSMGGADNLHRIIKLGSKTEETDAREVVARLNTVSMFGGGSLMLVGPLESLPKESAEPLAAYAANPNPQSTLVVCAAAEKKETIKSLEDSPFAAVAAKTGLVVRFDSLTGAALSKWVADRLAEQGVAADGDAAAMLAEYSGGQSARLAAEIDKAAAYAGFSGRLSAQDVEQIIPDGRTPQVWSLTGAFLARDLRASASAMDQLLADGAEPQMILKTLALEVGKATAARDVKRRGGSPEELAGIIGEPPFTVRTAWEKAGIWDTGRAHAALTAILKAQMDMMTAQVSAETAMETMLLACMDRP